MFDFVRDLRKSAAEKRQERLNAYVDGELSPSQRQAFEQELAQDAALQAELDLRRQIKAQLSQLPRRAVPRYFTLDPAQYGRPAHQPLFQLYPVLQTATALTAVFLIMTVGLILFGGGLASGELAEPVAYQAETINSARDEVAAEAADEVAAEAPAEPAFEGEAGATEVTRVVTETIVEIIVETVTETVVEEASPMMAETTAEMESADTAVLLSTPAPLPTTTVTGRSAIPTPTPPTATSTVEPTAVVPTTVVPTATPPATPSNGGLDGWQMASIAALGLFTLLLGLTLYVRRQMI